MVIVLLLINCCSHDHLSICLASIIKYAVIATLFLPCIKLLRSYTSLNSLIYYSFPIFSQRSFSSQRL